MKSWQIVVASVLLVTLTGCLAQRNEPYEGRDHTERDAPETNLLIIGQEPN